MYSVVVNKFRVRVGGFGLSHPHQVIRCQCFVLGACLASQKNKEPAHKIFLYQDFAFLNTDVLPTGSRLSCIAWECWQPSEAGQIKTE